MCSSDLLAPGAAARLGVSFDTLSARKPSIVVCDRANNTLQYFTLDGTAASSQARSSDTSVRLLSDLANAEGIHQRSRVVGHVTQRIGHARLETERGLGHQSPHIGESGDAEEVEEIVARRAGRGSCSRSRCSRSRPRSWPRAIASTRRSWKRAFFWISRACEPEAGG